MADILAEYPSGNALVRTTTALTMMGGSSKENILPARPWALVNFRAVPGDTSDSILKHVGNVVGDLGVSVDYEDMNHIHEPSAISSSDTPEYRAIVQSLNEVRPGLPVLPGIFPAATDSRHYCRLADNVYRFQPVHLGTDGIAALHSAGESVSVTDYIGSIRFYGEYMRRVCLE
jgi:carboxypeptidase PM20D1